MSGVVVAQGQVTAAGQTDVDDTSSDVNNCGVCGNACGSVNATPYCSGGTCQIKSCNAGFADCDGNPANGCETNIYSDVANCGKCGLACSTNHVSPSCSVGQCVGTCEAGYADCNYNKQTDGCETNVATDVNNCGGCGVVCSTNHITPICANFACGGSCDPGYADCNNNKQTDGCETNLATDANNCGACGFVCTSKVCVAGVCK